MKFHEGDNWKYIWVASFWDEKLGVGGWADKKIAYYVCLHTIIVP